MWRRSSVGRVAAALGLLVVIVAAAVWLRAGGGPVTSPATPSQTLASSTPAVGYAPYELAEASGPENAEQPAHLIHTPADCTSLADDWLRQLCTLTLTADWRAIAVAPISEGGQSLTGPAWWAVLARAVINGDPTFCFDGTMRTFDTMGHSGGAAPPPDVTPAPVHPVAECLALLRSTAAKGSFSVTDQGPGITSGAAHESGPPVTLTVSLQAVELSAQGVAPTFDPAGGCVEVTRTVCDQVLAAMAGALGDRLSTVTEVEVVGQVVGCVGAAATSAPPSSCPPPPGGTWVGGLVAAGGAPPSAVLAAFDIVDLGGQITLVEVPYHR